MNLCKRCGTCCRAITVTGDVLKYRMTELLGGDIINLNWRPITRERAIEINPRLIVCGEEVFFYSCRLFDEKTSECMIHYSKCKPRACLEFPWYDRDPYDCLTCSDDCGFIEYYQMMKSFARLDPKIFMI